MCFPPLSFVLHNILCGKCLLFCNLFKFHTEDKIYICTELVGNNQSKVYEKGKKKKKRYILVANFDSFFVLKKWEKIFLRPRTDSQTIFNTDIVITGFCGAATTLLCTSDRYIGSLQLEKN